MLADWRLEVLINQAIRIHDELRGENDLEAMAQIIDFAADIYDGIWEEMSVALSLIFLGDPVSGSGSLWTAYRSPNGPLLKFGDKGFHPDFRDYSNQPYHVWGYIVESASPRNTLTGLFRGLEATIGNYVHENPLSGGSSWQDFLLSEAGIYIGWQLTVNNVTPTELGSFIRYTLGPNAPPELTSQSKTLYSPFERLILKGANRNDK